MNTAFGKTYDKVYFEENKKTMARTMTRRMDRTITRRMDRTITRRMARKMSRRIARTMTRRIARKMSRRMARTWAKEIRKIRHSWVINDNIAATHFCLDRIRIQSPVFRIHIHIV